MQPFSELATQHFDFLATQYGFTRDILSPTRVRYASDRVYFEITQNPRDGNGIAFGRLVQSSRAADKPEEWFDLSVFVGAIRTHLGEYREEAHSQDTFRSSAERVLAHLSAGLAEFGRGLITSNQAMYEKVVELRFWHVGNWTQRWGTSILMSGDEIERQRRLVPALLELARQC